MLGLVANECLLVRTHDFLVPSGSGSGSGVCLPTFLSFLFSGKGFCSIMISCFSLVPAQVPGFVSLLFSFFSQTALELNGVLNCSKKQALFHHDFLVPSGSG